MCEQQEARETQHGLLAVAVTQLSWPLPSGDRHGSTDLLGLKSSYPCPSPQPQPQRDVLTLPRHRVRCSSWGVESYKTCTPIPQ